MLNGIPFRGWLFIALGCAGLMACSQETSTIPTNGQVNPTGSTPPIAVPLNTGSSVAEFNDDSFFLTVGKYRISKTDAVAGRSSELLDPPTGVEYISPADIVGDLWIASTDTGYFVMHDVKTGDFIGEAYMGGRNAVFDTPSAVVCAETICYVMNNIYELNAYEVFPETGTGRFLWDKKIFDYEAQDRDLNNAQIVVAKDHIYVAGDMDEAGTTSIWAINRHTQNIDKSVKIQSQLYGTPLVTDTKVIVPLSEALVALNIDTFEPLWNTPFNGTHGFYRTGPPSIARSVVAVSSFVLKDPDDDKFDRRKYVGLDENTGAILWSADAGDADGFQFAPQSNGVNFFGAVTEYSAPLGYRQRKGDPIGIEATTGRVMWTHDDFVGNTPLAVGNRVYFVDMFGQEGLVGLSAATGQVLYATSGSVGSFPETTALYHDGKMHRYSWAPAYKP